MLTSPLFKRGVVQPYHRSSLSIVGHSQQPVSQQPVSTAAVERHSLFAVFPHAAAVGSVRFCNLLPHGHFWQRSPLYTIPAHGRFEQRSPLAVFRHTVSRCSSRLFALFWHTTFIAYGCFCCYSPLSGIRRLPTVDRLSAALLAHGLLLPAFAFSQSSQTGSLGAAIAWPLLAYGHF